VILILPEAMVTGRFDARLNMLTTLRIKNLALMPDLALELQPGYTVITGETGAGKSILIGALNLLLGERADRTLIRSGSESCSVEAIFDISKLRAPIKNFLEENGLEPCEENQLVLKRTFTNTGANRQFVNGSPTTLAALAAIGEWLVDIHGPHDHQSLLHPAKQLAILDAFGNLEKERETFAGLVRERAAIEAEKSALIVDEKTYAQQLDLLRFQANEISTAKLQPDEDKKVEEDFRRASNAAKLLQLSQTTLELLSENENSLLAQAGAISRELKELERLDAGAAPIVSLHKQAASILRELQSELSRYAEKVDVEPARLQQLEERLNLIHSLKRKYGATLVEVITFEDEVRRQLHDLEQRDEQLGRLNADLAKLDSKILRLGLELSAKRRKTIPKLGKAVSRQLDDLGFKQGRLDVAMISETEVSNFNSQIPLSGFDRLEFQFTPNPGESPRPLRVIASSGELARVMLALKTVLAAEDEIPVLVFDEVDANVGGETANTVGEKMQQIAMKRQVLCITHLPQVAATADNHFMVTKQMKEGRTISEIRLLTGKERVTELTRMLGGQSEAARKHAEVLVSQRVDSSGCGKV
jgi:DNA repair protein RecN (Recombination protein N)